MTKHRIKSLHAHEILDSRGHPTVEVTVTLSGGETTQAAVPSGASAGQFEAWELRDADPERYNGRGVLAACRHVNEDILPHLRGMNVTEQRDLDDRMRDLDGTPNKSKLGANAILGVSLACARAGAVATEMPLYAYLRQAYDLVFDGYRLPEPMLNILNGGKHADNGLDFQEYMVIPHGRTFADRLEIGENIEEALGELLKMEGLSTLVGDEGGFAPHLATNLEPLQYIARAIERTKHPLGKAVHLGLDAAASEFYVASDRTYFLKQEQRRVNTDELIDYYREIIKTYPFLSIEDGLADVDEDGWERMTKAFGKDLLIVGDDIFVTNPHRLEHGIRAGIGNAVIIKPNQIGTLSESIDAVQLAQSHHYTPVISHRSGETTDSFIADLAVAVNAPYIKAGATTRGERLAKYNRLLEIEEALK